MLVDIPDNCLTEVAALLRAGLTQVRVSPATELLLQQIVSVARQQEPRPRSQRPPARSPCP